jgi:hypothetical protein
MGGVKVLFQLFLTSALHESEWPIKSRLRYRQKDCSTHWTRGWMGSNTGLDIWRIEKITASTRIQTPHRPARRPVIIPTELPRILTATVRYCFHSTYTLLYCVCVLFFRTDCGSLERVMQLGTHTQTFRRTLWSISSQNSSAMKMEAASSIETLVPGYQTTICHKP